MATTKGGRKASADDKMWADFKRESAEYQARAKAMQEFRAKEREQRYRENPRLLEIAIEQEEKENAFLKSKGLKPYPSMIPTELRRKARHRALLLAQRNDRVNPGRAKRR